MRVFAAPGLRNQTGVLSIVPEGQDVESVGQMLSEREVAVRTGIHCAPLAHRSAGTLDTGTIRLSFSDFNTPEEVFQVLEIFRGLQH